MYEDSKMLCLARTSLMNDKSLIGQLFPISWKGKALLGNAMHVSLSTTARTD